MKNFWHVRPARTVALVIFSVLGLAVSVIVVWASAHRLGQGSWPPPLSDWLAELNRAALDSTLVLGIGLGLCLLGLIALLCALVPGRRRTVLLRDSSPTDEQVLALGELSDLVRTTAEGTDGVASARAKATARSIDLVVRTPLRQVDGVRADVQTRVDRLTADLPLSARPTVRIRIRPEGD